MIGKPISLPLPAIAKIQEAIKLSENATDLDFKTSFKLSRLGDCLEPPMKTYSKLRTEASRKFQMSAKNADDLKALNEATDQAEALVETIYMPEFKLSEFVYTSGEKKDKLKVPQAFLNRFISYIKDDVVKLPEVEPVRKEVEPARKEAEIVDEVPVAIEG